MLRRHNVTLEYIDNENVHRLNVDGYTIYLTQDDMNNLKSYVKDENIHAIEQVMNYLKDQDPNLYDAKFTSIADNPNALDTYEVLKCQFIKPIHTQKPES